MFIEAVKFAFRGSISRSAAWAPVVGAFTIWAVAWLFGYEVVVPETFIDGIKVFIACAGTAWMLIIVGRFVAWPYVELRAARAALADPLAEEERTNVLSRMQGLDPPAISWLRKILVGEPPNNAPDAIWQTLENAKLVTRDFVGKVGVNERYRATLADWFRANPL